MLSGGYIFTIGGEKMRFQIGCGSPWGPITSIGPVTVDFDDRDQGVIFVGTAGHGGYIIDDKNLPLIPENWHGWGPNFYEEDCCAVAVAACVLKIDRAIQDLPVMYDLIVKVKHSGAKVHHPDDAIIKYLESDSFDPDNF